MSPRSDKVSLRGEEQLLESAAFEIHLPMNALHCYANKIPSGAILVVNINEEIVLMSSPLCQEITVHQEQYIGQPVSKLLPLQGCIEELYDRHFIHFTGILPVIRLMRVDGTFIRSQFSIYRVITEEETFYLLYFHDILTKPELSLLQQFSGTFMKTVNLGVILIDTDFQLIDISDMACTILGIQREDILYKTMEDVFASVPIEHQLVQRTLLDGIVVRNHAVSWMNDQERFELLMDSNLLRNEKGDIVGAYVLFKDVSNLRSLEEQVQRSDRLAMIGQIAAGTAHEIRNPLTSIKGFLQMFKKTLQERGMDKEYSYTEIMLSEIDRINELVSEFLLLSKPKNISFDLVDISTVLRDILPIINNEAILHGVSVQFQAAFELPKVVANVELLKQVFLNLCKNGIEAMSTGGVLAITERIEMDVDSQKVNIDIHDSGPGIPAFLIDKIFDPFFTTKQNGTGLGLSVCQRIIHDIGGSIRVSSKGYGTTFTVSIPYNRT